jgi:hypothetical protein
MTERELIAALAALPRPDPPEALRERFRATIKAESQATDREQDMHIEIFRNEPYGPVRTAPGQPHRRGNVFHTKHRFIRDGGTETIILLQEGSELWK